MTDLPEAEVWNKLGIASYTKVISPFWRELSLNQLNRSLWLALLGSDQKICNRHFFNKLICHKGALAVLLGENFQQYKVKIISSRISGIQYIFKKKKEHQQTFPGWLQNCYHVGWIYCYKDIPTGQTSMCRQDYTITVVLVPKIASPVPKTWLNLLYELNEIVPSTPQFFCCCCSAERKDGVHPELPFVAQLLPRGY